MAIITEKWNNLFEGAYLEDILRGLEEIQKENNYTDEEMDNNLDVALWRAYVYNNMDSYEYYELAEKTLAKVKDEGVKSGVWCYRYSCALVYLRRFDEALEYSRLGTKVEPEYPWGWLQLGRLCYKYNLLDEAYNAIDKGLELVPNDYEFLTLKNDIENDRGYAYANSHYIDEEADKNSKERLINIDDEELYQAFANKSDLEKKLDRLHQENKNQEIIDIITSLPKEELDYNILGKLARAYNNNRQYEKGLEVLLSLKVEGENDSLWNFRIGYSYYYSEKGIENLEYLEEAKKYFEKALELNPNEPDGDVLLRWVYSDLGNRKLDEEKNDEAFEYFEKARDLAKDTDDIIATESELAWAYDHIKDYEKAYEHLQTTISLGRDDIWLHSELGFCLGGMEKYKEAIIEFEKAVELGRDDSWVYAKLGSLYKELEKYDKALEYNLKGLESDPEDIYIICELAWLYDNIEDNCEKGLEYLKKAKELGRDDIWINSEFGWVYNHLREYEKALIHLEKTKELGRDDEWINFEFGYSLVRSNKIQEGIEYYKKAIELGKDDISTNSEIGYWLDYLEKYEEALNYFEKAVALGREDDWINGQIGFSLAKLGKTKEALEYFEKAKFINPDSEWISFHLGSCYRKLGEIPKAIEILKPSAEKGEYRGWTELELAWCYALIDEKEKAQEYLKEADLYIGGEILSSLELKKDVETIKQLISMTTYIS
jgi:tetratricopeptide (TPR) repeat protein